MKKKDLLIHFILSFFVTTTCISIVMGVLGVLLLPDARFGYEAYFAPPIIGFLSCIIVLITYSSKELTIKQEIIRQLVCLALIEIMIFAINYAAGGFISITVSVSVAIGVCLVYIAVTLVLWLNDNRSARIFNKELKKFQERINSSNKMN